MMFKKLWLILPLLITSQVFAMEIPTDVKVKLQAAMHNHIDQVSVDGAYSYLDKSTELKTLYPANTHPMVLRFGEDYFVCSDMVDENGDSHPADFLVRRIGDDYRVVQMLVDQRDVVEAAMKKGGK
jgi:hypothetical protein